MRLTISRPVITEPVILDPLAVTAAIRIRRPDTPCRIAVEMLFEHDGGVVTTRGSLTGGDGRGAYQLVTDLGYRVLGERILRIGQTTRRLLARFRFTLLEGADTDLHWSRAFATAPAPHFDLHHSVSFDAATAAKEVSGDGVLSLSHTAGGGTERAVFAGVSNYGTGAGSASTSCTYGGNAMTEMWDVTTSVLSNLGNAGYRLAIGSSLTGSQTVTSTLAASNPVVQMLQVISMDGVDQTTPVGTSNTSGPNGTSQTPSVTVSGTTADGMVVDNLCTNWGGGEAVYTAGADQTERNSLVDGSIVGVSVRGSTQPASAGGVMSWSIDVAPIDSFIGAVEFKAASVTPYDPGAQISLGSYTQSIFRRPWR